MPIVSEDEGANGMTDLQVRLEYCRSRKDDWTKVEDMALRKRIQNRLAKRKSRKKEPKDKTKKKREPFKEPRTAETTNDRVETSKDAAGETERETPWTDTSGDILNELWTPSSSNSPPIQDDADNMIQSIFAVPGLAEHRYICLTEYSVLRAFVQNASLLAMDPLISFDDHALSPWTTANPCPVGAPYDLSPTSIQLSTPHHPYLDILALPSLRDNVLLSVMTDEQEDQLCYEMHSGSFMIWGSQPWNSLAWEISQAFVTNWAWLVDDEIIRCSNFWRAERGEGPLVVPHLSGSVLGEIS